MNAIVPLGEALEPTSEVISILEEFMTELEAGARLNPEDLTARCPACLLYTSPSPRDRQKSRMPSSA